MKTHNIKWGVAFAALTLGSQYLAVAQEAEPAIVEEDEVSIQDVVVVTGVRASLNTSLQKKRSAVGVVDGIFAEDVVAFPDLNVSEALQRVTGVTIDRGPQGEGNQVSVRGLSADFTRSTLNGVTAASANGIRGLDYNIFASELFSELTLSKTPSADLTEGGLAATVNLETPRALDFNENQFAIAASAQYSELGGQDNSGVDALKPRLSALASRQFMDGKLGVLVSGSYSETETRGDIAQGLFLRTLGRTGFNPVANRGVLINGIAENDPVALQNLANNVRITDRPRSGPFVYDRNRLGLTGAIDYQPSDVFEFGVDLLYARFEDNAYRPTFAAFVNGANATSLTIQDDRVISGQFRNARYSSDLTIQNFDNELIHLTSDAEWRLNNAWELYGQVGYSKAAQEEDLRNYNAGFIDTLRVDFSNIEYPQYGGDRNFADPSIYVPTTVSSTPRDREDDEFSARLDVDREFQNQALWLVEGGVQFRSHETSQERLSSSRALTNFVGLSTPLPVNSNYLRDAPAGTPTNWLVFDPALTESQLPAPIFTPRLLDTFGITEDIIAGYLKTNWQFDIAGMPLAAELGVRAVKTDQTSTGFALSTVSGTSPVSVSQSYTDVLPNFNARLNLSDTLIARFAANRAMTRPPLQDLSPGISFGPADLRATAGNPLLEPFRATQLDLALEWYFADEALLSATVFYKELDSFIIRSTANETINGAPVQVTRPTNGDEGELKGIELSYQQPFTFLPAPFDGFGIVANATFTESSATTQVGSVTRISSVPGQSDLSYNLVGYYENDLFSARLAYSFRDSYFELFEGDFDRFVDNRGQLDVALKLHVNENVTLTFDGINVNGEDSYTYQDDERFNFIFFDQGPVYLAGVKFKL